MIHGIPRLSDASFTETGFFEGTFKLKVKEGRLTKKSSMHSHPKRN